MIRKILCIVLLLTFSSPIISAKMLLNKEQSITHVNSYISRYSDYRTYLVNNTTGTASIPFRFANFKNITDPYYIHAGFLTKDEYVLIGAKESYLYDPNSTWLMENYSTASSYVINNSETGLDILDKNSVSLTKATEFVKNGITVTGRGTRGDPWKFVPVPSDITYTISSTIPEAFTTVTGNVLFDESKSVTINTSNLYTFKNATYSCSGTGVSSSVSVDGYSMTLVFNNMKNNIVCSITPKNNSFKVTFNGNGGTSVSPTTKTVTNGSTYGTLAVTSNNNTCVSFGGWYTAASGGSQILSSSLVNLTNDITLYARWNSNPSGGTWNACNYTSLSGTTASGIQYNTCGASQTCSSYCAYSYSSYSGDSCGDKYDYYSCGYSRYAEYTDCLLPPTCHISIENTFYCSTGGDAYVFGWSDYPITSCYWSGLKKMNGCGLAIGGSVEFGYDCGFCDGAIIGVTRSGGYCNNWNTLSLYVENSKGNARCSEQYYVY